MKRTTSVLVNGIFFLHVLLLFLVVFEDRVQLPIGLHVVGRMHVLLLHLPIGFICFAVLALFIQHQFKSKPFQRLFHFTLLLASLSAMVTAMAGFFLAHSGDYDAEQIQLHQRSGLAVSLLAYGLLLINTYQVQQNLIRLGSGVTFILLLVAGHSGATLTHGENFIWEPVRKQEPLTAATVYQAAIEPVLEKKCFSCHNESKAKGKLVMTSPERFRQGGEQGKAWIAGNPDSSRMIQYIHLPTDHDHHMPPEGKPQLTEAEVLLLEAWIRSGANFQLRWTELPETDSLRRLAEATFTIKKTTTYSFDEVPAEVIAKLNTPYCSVFPLYQGSPALQADFFLPESFDRNSLAALRPIREQLVVMNLNKMPLSGEDVTLLSQFENLESLNLNMTGITDVALPSLAALSKLKSLALSGNPVSHDAVVQLLASLNLTKIYLWNTAVTQSEATTLCQQFPDTEIVHVLFTDQTTQVLSKPILVNEGVLKPGEEIQLKHPMPGAVIRYSLDGSEPDSIQGYEYQAPIPVQESVVLKSRACREGWYCSPVLETTIFVAGIKPTQATLLTAPDKKYRGEGASSLIDGRKGFTDILNEPSWLGYRENPFEAMLEFKPAAEIKKVVLSYANNHGSYLMPPATVEVWAGSGPEKLKLITTKKVDQPSGYEMQRLKFVSLDLQPGTYGYIKVVARPVARLPEWHSGKGQKGWLFIDELFFY